MSYKPKLLPIADGGTNTSTMATSTGIVKYDGTSLVTSSTALIDSSNRMLNSSQPAFLARRTSTVNNVTGDGTVYTIAYDAEVFDVGSNFSSTTFTAPVTGLYLLFANITLVGLTASHTAGKIQIVTTNVATTTTGFSANYGAIRDLISNAVTVNCVIVANMTALDTAYSTVTVSNGTKVVDVFGSTDAITNFGGYLLN